MELYLDSVDPKEIEEAFKFGTLAGLTTTPTFLHRHGVTDIDAKLLELAEMVPILQVEALGNNADEIVAEAQRQLEMGLKKDRTVFKIPVSNQGIIACRRLRDEGIMVNIHLVYTLQQAYMAALADATYICPLAGRLQDQGHDAIALIEQCVDMVDHYEFNSKIMFSSVRYPEHVRNALNIGCHTITVPWKVMKNLTSNNFTTVGTNQFIEHTRLVTMTVAEVIRDVNPTVHTGQAILDAIVEMTNSGVGATSVVGSEGQLVGILTDGDLRRLLKSEGKLAVERSLADLDFKLPYSIAGSANLLEAVNKFKEVSVDNLVVTDEAGKPIGMLDIQDLVKLNVM